MTDLLPAACLPRVRNLDAFLGAVVFDKWTCNTDRRQAVYVCTHESAWYSAFLVDQGHCFNATNWDFPDSPLYGLYGSREVYLQVTSWESFEPWLTCLETLDAQEIWDIANSASPAWYERDLLALARLVSQLVLRQRRLRRFIADLKHSTVDPFPNWRQSAFSYPAAGTSSRARQKPAAKRRSKPAPSKRAKP